MPQNPYRRTIDPKRLIQLLSERSKPTPPPPEPEPGLVERFAPPALRGIGMLLGLTPLRGMGASAIAETAAQGVEGRFDPKEIAIAGVMGGMGGAATKSLLSNLSKPLVAGAKGAAWGAGSPLVRDVIDPEYDASGTDVALGGIIGGGVAGGLAKLLGRLNRPMAGPAAGVDNILGPGGDVIRTVPRSGPPTPPPAVPVREPRANIPYGAQDPPPYRAAARAAVKAEEAEATNQTRLTTIEESRRGNPSSSFSETLSATTPEGSTARMNRKWAEPDPNSSTLRVIDDITPTFVPGTKTGDLYLSWIERGASPEDALKYTAAGTYPPPLQSSGLRTISDDLAPDAPPTTATSSSVIEPVPPPLGPGEALARFFRGEADQLGNSRDALGYPNKFNYHTTQAAEKAGEYPKTNPFFELDSRGRPITPARMQGSAFRKFGDASGGSPQAPVTPVAPQGPAMAKWGDEERTLTPGLRDIPINPMAADAEIPGADAGTVQNLMEGLADLAKRGGGERGAISPELLARLGLGAGGALIGGATDPLDNPALSAVAGGAVGFSVPSLVKLAQTAGTRLVTDPTVPDAIKRVVQPLAQGDEASTIRNFWREIPSYLRSGMLVGPNLPNNAFLGPWGSGMAAATELKMAGDPMGDVILQLMSPANWAKEYHNSIPIAAQILKDSRAVALERIEGVPTMGLAQMPALWMTSGDITTRRLLQQAGMSEELARKYTLTSEPGLPVLKKLLDFQRAGGPLAQVALPFAKTIANIVEQSSLRAPVLGKMLQKSHPELAYPEAVQTQQQVLGSAIPVMAGGLGFISPDEDDALGTVNSRMLRSAVTNIAGPYSGLASIGFGMGKAMQNPDPKLGNVLAAGANEALQTVPLPTTDVPASYVNAFRDLLNGEFPPTRVPSGVPVSGLINPWLKEKASRLSPGRPQRPRRTRP